MGNFTTKKNCDRCKTKLTSRTMSWLNEDVICMDCSDKERSHDKFKQAKEAEIDQVRRGNYNYGGLLL